MGDIGAQRRQYDVLPVPALGAHDIAADRPTRRPDPGHEHADPEQATTGRTIPDRHAGRTAHNHTARR